jgi:hypothetical protein
MVSVQYIGSSGTVARFVRTSIAIETGAATMNSTPIILPHLQQSTTTGCIGTVLESGTTTTYGTLTIIPARTPAGQMLAEAPGQFDVDVSKTRVFEVAGQHDVQPTSLTHRGN